MAKIVAIDPGPTESAWIQYDTESGPEDFAFEINEVIVETLATRALLVDTLVIEKMQHYGSGMPIGDSVLDTCIWIGQFKQEFGRHRTVLIPNPVIRAQLCRSIRASQANIHQALVDRFGGKDKAVGGVKCRKCKGKGWYGGGRPTCTECNGLKWLHPPGPLHGITSHVWSALAVAVCWQEMQDQARIAIRPPPWEKPG